MRSFLAGVLLCAVPMLSAAAQPTIVRDPATGLTSPSRVIDLSNPNPGARSPVGSTLAASQGITFDGALYVAAGDAFNLFSVPSVLNGLGSEFAPVITMTFSEAVLGVAFNVFAQRPSTVRFEATYELAAGGFGTTSFSGVAQDPTVAGERSPLKWWGFEGARISSVRVFAPAELIGGEEIVWALGLANITVQDPLPVSVPEPASFGLLAAGAAALFLRRRR